MSRCFLSDETSPRSPEYAAYYQQQRRVAEGEEEGVRLRTGEISGGMLEARRYRRNAVRRIVNDAFKPGLSLEERNARLGPALVEIWEVIGGINWEVFGVDEMWDLAELWEAGHGGGPYKDDS